MATKELAHQHAVYSYGAVPLTLMYSPTATAAWEVYYGGDYLGLIEELHTPGVDRLFRARRPGEEDFGEGTDLADWRLAVEYLASQAGL